MFLSEEQTNLDPRDIHDLLSICQAHVIGEEPQKYAASLIASFASNDTTTLFLSLRNTCKYIS
ncbi:hypothetical protein [Vibrio diazotrophicus]|uniref:hypothetical protein n=1 Tax=Vibrio diazotrophicus TaxID=685 RepID=UPI0015E0A2D5|nr:hypothetical protein [Vibrio diazotrophicus]